MSGRTPPAAWMTERGIALARALWDEGVLTTEIGRRCGTTKHAIVGFAHRNGWPPRPSPLGRRRGEERQATPRTPEKPHRARGAPPTRRVPAKTEVLRRGCEPAPLAAPTLSFGTCQWIEGADRRTWRFCSQPATHGAWCAEHHARAYTRPPRWDRLAA